MSGRMKAWTEIKQKDNKDAANICPAPPVPKDTSFGSAMGPTMEMAIALVACTGTMFFKRRIFLWLGMLIATHALATSPTLFPSTGQSPIMGIFFLLTQVTNNYKDLFMIPPVTPVVVGR